VGCPIRISTDQRLLAAPRGFSQRATSFIASWCQGIHRMPFLYSISRTRSRRSEPHHAQKPSSDTGLRHQVSAVSDNRNLNHRPRQDSPGNIYSAHNRIFPYGRIADRLRDPQRIHPAKSFTTPLTTRHPTVGALVRSTDSDSRSDTRPDNGTATIQPIAAIARTQRRTRT
jgi:hypothetical protein